MEESNTKTCSKCHLVQKPSDFHWRDKSKTKTRNSCKMCDSAVHAARRRKRPGAEYRRGPCTRCGKMIAQVTGAATRVCRECYRVIGRCAGCGRMLPLDASTHRCAELKTHCRSCAIELTEANRVANGGQYKPCNSAESAAIIRDRRRQAKALFGTCCGRCGYSRCTHALDFHHRFPDSKEKYAGRLGVSPRHVIKHPEMYELLCANCHREEHHPD